MAKVAVGDSGAVTRATLKRDVTRAASTGTAASLDGEGFPAATR